jgi:hypothetical protein
MYEQVCATAIARETGQTIVDARKRIWLVDSEVRLLLHRIRKSPPLPLSFC